MTLGCFTGFVLDQSKVLLIGGSIFLAILMLLVFRRTQSTKYRIGLIYGHLSFLFFPIMVFTTELSCKAACAAICGGGTDAIGLALLALPATLTVSTIAGFVLIPTFYMLTNKKYEIKSKGITSFVREYSKKLAINQPKVYAVNKTQPVAFSFRSHKSAIFLSIGLTDILNKKELQAVLLHELAHIKEKSSAMKLSNTILNIFSPFSRLAGFHDTGNEEHKADTFVVNEQRTNKYLKSAKIKMNEFR